ncbi:unnamed protein product [Cuscuta epithymum]|nr:unnamed protein product [Cuscuta epithymum]
MPNEEDTKSLGQGKSNTAGWNRGKPTAKAHTAAIGNSKILQPSSSVWDGSLGQSTPLPGFSAEQWNSLISDFGNLSSSYDPMAGPSLEEVDWNG